MLRHGRRPEFIQLQAERVRIFPRAADYAEARDHDDFDIHDARWLEDFATSMTERETSSVIFRFARPHVRRVPFAVCPLMSFGLGIRIACPLSDVFGPRSCNRIDALGSGHTIERRIIG